MVVQVVGSILSLSSKTKVWNGDRSIYMPSTSLGSPDLHNLAKPLLMRLLA